jgi:universal stress protein A
MLNYKQILYATDLHETCKLTLKRVIGFAAKFDAKVTVIHIVKSTGTFAYTGGAMAEKLCESIEQETKDKLDKLMTEVGLNSNNFHILTGPTATMILKYADKEKVDAIIINGHSHNFLSRMKSTEDCIVNNAECDVIVLR